MLPSITQQIPGLQQVFSDACKVRLGYKALHGPILQKKKPQTIKPTKPKKTKNKKTMMAAFVLHIFQLYKNRGQLPEVHCQHRSTEYAE